MGEVTATQEPPTTTEAWGAQRIREAEDMAARTRQALKNKGLMKPEIKPEGLKEIYPWQEGRTINGKLTFDPSKLSTTIECTTGDSRENMKEKFTIKPDSIESRRSFTTRGELVLEGGSKPERRMIDMTAPSNPYTSSDFRRLQVLFDHALNH